MPTNPIYQSGQWNARKVSAAVRKPRSKESVGNVARRVRKCIMSNRFAIRWRALRDCPISCLPVPKLPLCGLRECEAFKRRLSPAQRLRRALVPTVDLRELGKHATQSVNPIGSFRKSAEGLAEIAAIEGRDLTEQERAEAQECRARDTGFGNAVSGGNPSGRQSGCRHSSAGSNARIADNLSLRETTLEAVRTGRPLGRPRGRIQCSERVVAVGNTVPWVAIAPITIPGGCVVSPIASNRQSV